MELVSITRSPRAGKKWRAKFRVEGRERHTDFGAVGYEDYTQHGDEKRAAAYRKRHQKDLATRDPTRAGFLSYYILWASPNFDANVRAYRRRFGL
jgi:hypothetical protein